MIDPRTLKGFRDFLPEAMMPREQLIDTARRVYRSYGYSPIDTPVLEYLEILQGKGSEETDRLMYRFEDNGGRQVGMRFDLTVPLARFVAQHIGQLGTPFKRYHIAKVWRGENTHRGRYREFMQCDFDTIGTESVAADAETVLVVHDLLHAIGIVDFRIHVNNRRVLTGLLARLDLAHQTTPVLRALDKLGKIGPEQVQAEMIATAGATADQARQIVRLCSLTGTNDQILSQLDRLLEATHTGQQGVAELRQLLTCVEAAGMDPERCLLDVSIARGLDYYTGTVIETFLGRLPQIGSVCSGGRYDDLASVYTKERLPGIGASLGLDRLLAAMEELGMIEHSRAPAPLLIPYFDKDHLGDYLRIAALLRRAGIGVEVYPEPRKLGQQLKYADRRGFRLALIAGSREFAEGQCQLKDLRDGSQEDVPLEEQALLAAIRRRLGLVVG
jgi:histidyl-tRNA synthetase